MSAIKNARSLALDALLDIQDNKKYSEKAVDNVLEASCIDQRERALCSHLVYGVLQNAKLCDYYIMNFCKLKKSKISKTAMWILRLGVYQILFMDRIPQNAAVNECVNLSKKYVGNHVAGFVNGILRNICRNANDLPDIKASSNEEYLSIKYSHDISIVKLFIQQFGLCKTREILEQNNKIAPVCLRVNTLKCTEEQVLKELNNTNINYLRSDIPNCIFCTNIGNIWQNDIFKNGYITIQDAASQMAVYALNPEEGSTFIDCCAAPGGKSFLGAQLMNNKGKIISCDISPNKVDIINKNAQILGINIINSAVLDATKNFSRFNESADFILCDVPCSALGIIRKKPEIRFKTWSDIKDLPKIQLDIIKNCSRYVKPGGRLVYSTCTILECENQSVVDSFLKNNKDFEPESFALPNRLKSNGSMTILPGQNNSDGFFISKFRRKV